MAFRVHAWAVLCQQCVEEREGSGGWKKRKIQPQDDFTKNKLFISIFYNCFLCLSVPQWLFLLLLICFIFSDSRGKHLSTVLFSAEKSHSLPDLFLGAKQQVVLIYRDFITRKECFQNACLLLTAPSRACMHAVRVLSS